jgi:hypothetical protein
MKSTQASKIYNHPKNRNRKKNWCTIACQEEEEEEEERKPFFFLRCSSFQCHHPWHATHHMKKNSTKQKPINLVENRAKSFYLDLEGS